MESLARLAPFLWPHRRQFAISVVFGVMVALVWGGNLTAVLPIVKVLFEDQGLHASVDKTIAGYTEEIQTIETQLAEIAAQLESADVR
ncbi:MAG: hypothetical protein KF861_22700, partial [Planctomycetaceae bacterium]|nr:hypothetical protein [Planctomycetaceae bacterium]